MRRLVAIATVLAVIGLAVPAWADAIVVNGSFDPTTSNPYTSANSYEDLVAPSTAIFGWTVHSGSIDWISTYWRAADYVSSANHGYSLDMSGTNAGVIVSQVLGTTAGQSYKLTFEMAGNPAGPPTTKDMTVKVGAASQDFSFNTSGHSQTSMGWAPESLTFVATGTSTPLSFQSDDNTGFGPALDEVSVEPVGGSTGFVPEPTGIVAMLGLAVMGLLGLVWHRRTAA